MPSYVRQAYEEVEKLQRINGEIENGEFLRVVELRKANGVKYVGRLGEVLKAEKKKKSKPFLDETDVCNSESVFVQMAVEKAVKKCAALNMSKIEVAKQNVEKPLVLELPKIALHGGDVHKLMSWEVLKELVKDAERC
jgi:hypothetical protein